MLSTLAGGFFIIGICKIMVYYLFRYINNRTKNIFKMNLLGVKLYESKKTCISDSHWGFKYP